MSSSPMSDAEMAQQSIHLHERVGRLEQDVHTLTYRADSMEHIPPRVNTIEAHIASMQTEGQATRRTVERMDEEIKLLSTNQTRGFTSVRVTVWVALFAMPTILGMAFTIYKMFSPG